jgi:tetratricopeptide (TPR) repeat protein
MEISEDLALKYCECVKRRANRIPLQHITGEQEFMGYTFKVNEHVLIPRQDTEVLVEEALKYLRPGKKVLDMCTGSGCILLSLLKMGAENPEILNYVGGIYRDAEDIAKAEEYYNKSLTLNANQTDAYLGLGTTYFNKGITQLKEAEKVPLDDMTGAYDKMKNEAFEYFKKAIPNLNKVLETKPNDFQSLKALRNIYSLLNMKAEFQAIDAKLKAGNK